jgi:putative ABC transport system ATP-binding protein
LEDISLTLDPGERLAIRGPSGSGKTLLLRALALLDPLDAGGVVWSGKPLRGDAIPDYRRHVIYLHQRPALFEGTVETSLREPFALRVHRSRAFDRGRVLQLLEDLGRDASFLDQAPRDLSGGEAQLVALLRAIQLEPSVLLLDEPTAALDPRSAQAVERLVDRWLAEAADRRALIWVSHDAAQGARMTHRSLIMNAGRIAADA